MKIPLFQVYAFTRDVFAGNPAAIGPLEEWLEPERMQAIATENNLSETAFLVPNDDGYDLRWFTPTKPTCADTPLWLPHTYSGTVLATRARHCFSTRVAAC